MHQKIQCTCVEELCSYYLNAGQQRKQHNKNCYNLNAETSEIFASLYSHHLRLRFPELVSRKSLQRIRPVKARIAQLHH